jgi:hypothetical protein
MQQLKLQEVLAARNASTEGKRASTEGKLASTESKRGTTAALTPLSLAVAFHVF